MAGAEAGQAVEGSSRAPSQYLFVIGFLNPAASNLVRASACVPLSGNGPTSTRKNPSLDAGVSNVWKPRLVRVSLIISAPGREVATTCQYWPGAGSLVMDASPLEAGPTALGFGFAAATGAGLTGAGGGGCSACVVGGPDAAGFVSACFVSAGLDSCGLAGGSCAAGLELGGSDSAEGGSTATVLPPLCAASAAGAAELRPTI